MRSEAEASVPAATPPARQRRQGRTALRGMRHVRRVCREAGVTHFVRRTGPFLYEVAEWSQERDLAPINALVILEEDASATRTRRSSTGHWRNTSHSAAATVSEL
jgi:hypothetical protein